MTTNSIWQATLLNSSVEPSSVFYVESMRKRVEVCFRPENRSLFFRAWNPFDPGLYAVPSRKKSVQGKDSFNEFPNLLKRFPNVFKRFLNIFKTFPNVLKEFPDQSASIPKLNRLLPASKQFYSGIKVVRQRNRTGEQGHDALTHAGDTAMLQELQMEATD